MRGKKPTRAWEYDDELPDPKQPARERGLTKETIDAMRRYLLGIDEPVRTPTGQFEKGSSGNPRGRPKRARTLPAPPPARPDAGSLGEIVLRQVDETITANTENGPVKMTIKEAIVGKSVREAARGNSGHARMLATVIARAEAAAAAQKREVFSHWATMKAMAFERYVEARRLGEDEPLLVHPHDIQLGTDGTVTLLGPTEPHAITAMRRLHQRVEFHLPNIAYQRWMLEQWIRLHRMPGPRGVLYAEHVFASEQRELPPRLRLTAEELAEQLAPFEQIAGRELHRLLRQRAARFDEWVPPRELRVPLVFPREVIELVREKGLSAEVLVNIRLEAGSAESALSDVAIHGSTIDEQ